MRSPARTRANSSVSSQRGVEVVGDETALAGVVALRGHDLAEIGVLLDPPAQLLPVEARHHPVRQDQLRRVREDRVPGLFAVLREHHVVPRTLQPLGEDHAIELVVFRDHDANGARYI